MNPAPGYSSINATENAMTYAHDLMDAEIETPFPDKANGTVVAYPGNADGPAHGHERATLTAVAKQLAALKRYRFAGDYDCAAHYDSPVYFVPRETLLSNEARALAISNEDDLFGGVARYPFVATKTITHPLVDDRARAPEGWSHAFCDRVRDDVLPGYSAFSPEDARRSGKRLLQDGPVRLKLANGSGGAGQATARDAAELDVVLAALDPQAIRDYGLVLEHNLTEVTTYSVGQVRVGGMRISYYGTQRLTPNNQGEKVYGGSDLEVVQGDFDDLLSLALEPAAQLAVQQAQRYDAAAARNFPEWFASRRNYDVAQGKDAQGRPRSGVLEQSWRTGGATPAELPAIKAFLLRPQLESVRASSVEVYGECDPPPDAMVIFRGVDPKLGLLTKYGLVESDARRARSL
jgi:hypothetical protein